MTLKAAGSVEAIRREKAALRAQFRAVRQEMSEGEWQARSAAIRERLAALPELQQARTIHAFWPIAARREVDLRPLVAAWHAEGKTVVLPRVASTDPPRLSHHVWRPEACFAVHAWGVEEPAADWPVHDGPFDAVLVPALAVDRAGYRLGYGKGFYDAFLAETDALRLAPIFETGLADALPHEPHDQRTHVVVTEERCVRFAR